MSRICAFLGITIYMYNRDHQPPHFHAKYAGDEVLIDIATLTVIRGRIGPRALRLVIEWATMHQDELRFLWNRAQALQPLGRIAPLK